MKPKPETQPSRRWLEQEISWLERHIADGEECLAQGFEDVTEEDLAAERAKLAELQQELEECK